MIAEHNPFIRKFGTADAAFDHVIGLHRVFHFDLQTSCLIHLCLFSSALSLLPVHAEPAQVILIRHAEKPKDPDALHLSNPGKKRPGAPQRF